ncbi:MAG: hypothetical protein LBC67_07195 [Spirochaetales bacterium]|jgi:hypothetical protein|nr:hypothetical protein [Spirochaetales bacterium]
MNNWWKYGLAFAGGALVGAFVYKNTSEIRALCTRALGGALDLKDRAMLAAERVKESAEDLLAEADAKRKAAGPKEA